MAEESTMDDSIGDVSATSEVLRTDAGHKTKRLAEMNNQPDVCIAAGSIKMEDLLNQMN